MRNYKAANVDDYLNHLDSPSRDLLAQLREIIKSTVPDAEEKISWGIPFYWYHGALIGLSVFKNHVSFGFATQLSPQERKNFEDKGYHTGSKTVQIKFDQSVPIAEIKKLLMTQAQQNKIKKST